MKNIYLKTLLMSLLVSTSFKAVSDISLGSAADYNAIIFGDFSANSSDVEGRLAVQGNININNYSVGDKLDPNEIHDVLLSGGDVTFPSGRVYYGNILAAGSILGVGSAVTNGMEPGSRVEGSSALPIDFAATYNELVGLSQSLAQMSVNTSFDYQWGGLTLSGDCSSAIQVFNLDGATVLESHTFQVDCIPDYAYVVFNVSGVSSGLTNMSMASLENHRERVIYNFYEANTLTFSGIGVEGTVLAPHAIISNPQGVIKGQLFAQSWDGMMQINHVPFDGASSQNNQMPLADDQSFDLAQDENISFTLTASDVNGDNLSFRVIEGPRFGTLNGTAPEFEYVPFNGFIGVDHLLFVANDGELDSEVAAISFNVGQTQCELYPYVLEDIQVQNLQVGDQVNNYSTSVGNGNYSLLTWEGCNDTNTLAQSFVMPGDSHNYVNPDNSADHQVNVGDWIQGAPGKNNARHVRDALDDLIGQVITVPLWSEIRGSGSHLDYAVSDFAQIELTAYKLNGQSNISFIYRGGVACGNYAPYTLDNSFSTLQNEAVQFVLSDRNEVINGQQYLLAVTDGDLDGLEFIITSPTIHGTLTGIGPDYLYTPHHGFAGSDSFEFKVNDGFVDSNTSIVEIEVVSINQPPTAIEQNIQLNEDQSTNIVLNGEDPDGDELMFNLETLPVHGEITGTLPNLTYIPNANFFGTDSITFTVNDGLETSNPATVNINVIAVNDAPIATQVDFVTDEDVAGELILLGSDIDNNEISYQLVSQPTHGSLTGTIPDLIYTPEVNFNGSDVFTYQVSDGQLVSAVSSVYITVNPVNDEPIADSLNIQTQQNESINIILSGTDVDGDLLNYVIDTSPLNGTLTGSGANYIYTPTTDFYGFDGFTYHSSDGLLDSLIVTVDIHVVENNLPPEIVSEPGTIVDEQTSYVYDVNGVDQNNDTIIYSIDQSPNNSTIDTVSGVLNISAFDVPVQGNIKQNFYCRSGVQLQQNFEVTETVLWPLNGDIYNDVDIPPLVIRAIDSNGDGNIDVEDTPVVVFNAYQNSYSANKVVAVRADTLETVFINSVSKLYPSGPLAAADLDGDGIVEIVGTSTDRVHIIVLEHDGTEKFRAPINAIPFARGWSYPPTISDIDKDGSPEILIAGSVLDNQGNTLWTHDVLSVISAPLVTDLENDGINEVVMGGTVYAPDGTELWTQPVDIVSQSRIFSAIADINNEGHAEILSVFEGYLRAYDSLGTELWESQLIGGGFGGAPTVGQVNGQTVIGVAGAKRFHLFDGDGNILWTQPIQDASSSMTGSSMFDFNGDGRVEITYADERYFRIYDALQGSVLYETPNRSHTSLEFPVIADVNLDGAADILVVENGGTSGVKMLSGINPWVDTRSIWNQFSYHIDNINDDGTVPADPINSWQTHNTYRLNNFPDRSPLGIPDLAVSELELIDAEFSSVSVLVINRGLSPTPAETTVKFYNSDPEVGGQLLGEVLVPVLSANQTSRLTLTGLNRSQISANIYAVVDASNELNECIENNNLAAAELIQVRATDSRNLYDTQRFLVNVVDTNSEPIILTAEMDEATANEPYNFQFLAIDNDLGDALLYSISDGPYGLTIDDVSGHLFWIPDASQQGTHQMTLNVSDIFGAVSTQTFTINVLPPIPNEPPQITSSPIESIKVLETYEYLVTANDPDGDSLVYGLLDSPFEMSIHPSSGVITWVTNINDAGIHDVTVRVTDGRGGEAIQTYVLTVIGFEAPVIVSAPSASVAEYSSFSYDIDAVDVDNDIVGFNVLNSPAGYDLEQSTGVFTALMDTIPAKSITTTNQFCRFSGPELGGFDPVVKWQNTIPALSQPIVVPLQDTNGDGVMDINDDKVVLAVAWRGDCRPSYIIALDGISGELLWDTSLSIQAVGSGSSLAAADIDADGSIEIVAMRDNGGTVVFDHEGAIEWSSDFPRANSCYNQGAATIVDIEGDGIPEILAASAVLENNGSLRFEHTGRVWNASFADAIDLDSDGIKEVLIYDTVFDYLGNELWKLPDGDYARSFSAVNIDGDEFPELAYTSGTHKSVQVIDNDGTLIWRNYYNSYNATPLAIGDADGDGDPDLMGLVGFHFRAFDATSGAELWAHPVVEGSHTTGAVAFDFEGDGQLEAVYHDEQFLRVFDGSTGDVRYITPNNSVTSSEAPIVVDIDNDGHAEIVVSGNTGIKVIEDRYDSWVDTRNIWNQYAYSINNINDDLTVPANPEKSWLTHNTYRSNTFLNGHPLGTADLAVLDLKLVETDTIAEVWVEVTNRGLGSSSETDLVISNGDFNLGGQVLDNRVIPALSAGASLTFSIAVDPTLITTNLYAQIDVAENVSECIENNNSLTTALFEVQAIDAQNLVGQQRFTVLVENINEAPSFLTSTLTNAKASTIFRQVIEVEDPDTGDDISMRLINGPDGVRLDPFSGVLYWVPSPSQLGQHSIQIEAKDLQGLSDVIQLNILVEENTNNLPPYISSSANGLAYVDVEYDYQVVANDPNNNPLEYALLQSPAGMQIHPMTGKVNWIPESSQVGDHEIVIDVADILGASVQQTYTLQVIEVGTPPSNEYPTINSQPPFNAFTNSPYEYLVSARDADGDVLIFSLTEAPVGMTLAQNGLVTWTPVSEGTYSVVLRVSDGFGFIEQAWSIQVTTIVADNVAPEITSTPSLNATVNSLYSYDVIAVDADLDVLQYTLFVGPAGMQINSESGEISWLPTTNQVGVFDVVVYVDDLRGGFATQSFTISVQGTGINNPPNLTSVPGYIAKVGLSYSYQIMASDSDGDELDYELISGPAGMSVDANGLLTWVPSVIGSEDVIVRVSDNQYYINQAWNVLVLDQNVPLTATVTITPEYIVEGDEVTVQVIVTNAVDPVSINLTVDGQLLVLDENNETAFTADGVGSHDVVAEVSDTYETVTELSTYTVTSSTASAFPEVDILSPEDGAIITGFNDVVVSVQDDNLASWKLSYRNAEDDFSGRVTLAEGTDTVDDAVVANWDTSLLRNGIYVLLIEATDLSGQRSSVVHSVFLEGDLKLGHFSIAFEDMNIPVAGIPVTITRGYDTRDRNRDRAFGKGWSIGFESVRVQESRIPGLAWYMETGFYSIGPVRLPRYCVKPASEALVSVLLPDGQVEKFKVKAKTLNPASELLSNCQNIITPDYFGIEFIPQGDTTSTITSNLGQNNLKIINGNLEELTSFVPVDPNQYTLTMLDGTEYSLDQGFNVRKIKTTSGHELRFTENGIEHSGGLSVEFIRDAQGRITRIEKANGEGVDYGYDAAGDLVSFTDLNGNTTTFTYIQDHYLEDIIDPRGIRVARNEYDSGGRLVAHIDADGNRIEYDNNLIARTSTITDRRGNSMVNAFDNAGNIIAQTNALGETTNYEYNYLRLEESRTNHLGHRTEWTYDAQGNQLTETDPLGHVTTSTYNRKAELLTQVDALGQPVITNEYNPDYDPQRPEDPQHGYAQLKQVTDALGRITQFHWLSGINASTEESISVNTGFTDAAGNRYDISPISGGTNDGLTGGSTDLNGLRTETEYDDEARPLTETQIISDELGVTVTEYTTTYQYNANGDVVTVTDALGNITRTEYNALNKVSASIDTLGRRTEMEYDDRGNQVLTRYPDGSTETMVYDEENNVIESTDRAGRITKTIYDELNRVEAVIYPDDTPSDDTDNPMTVNSYDGAGRLVAVSDANGNTTTYEYDDAGRRTKTIDALGNETSSVYDALGRRTQSTYALGRVTIFEYNALGNLERTNFHNGSFTTTTYDQLSRKESATDLAGLSTQYEYDAAGNLVAVIDALNQRTEYTYDQRGNKLTQTDANNHTTVWTYDALNRVTSRTLPMGETESYGYDAVGNRVSKTDFNGDLTTYEYNDLNQLVLTTYADLSTVVNTYTITGQMETVTEINGTTGYSYDAQDRLTRIDYPTGNYIEYQYDLNGNRTQVKTPNQTVDYTFDQLNRLKTVTDATGTTTYTYDAVGNRETQTNANGTVATYTYDDLNRLTDLVHTDALNTILASYSYELGPNGNRLSLTEGTGRYVEYDYDDLYRLLSETVTDPINGDHFSQWAYDAVGNRLQQEIDGTITLYTYNYNDHLLTETKNSIVTRYDYDDNGNTLTKTVDTVIDTTYSYSKDNRMLTADTSTSSISYSYDAGGIRQSQTVNGQTINYLVDPNRSYHQVLEEQDDLFMPQVVYTYGDDLISQTNAQGVYTFGYDGLGSTRILTDVNGAVQNSYGYQAFGELDYQYGAIENNYLFTGEQYDNNVGFYYLRARYYNPGIGRFQNMDTFPGMQFEPKSLHKYLYTHADPINNVDPSGYVTLSSLMGNLRAIVARWARPISPRKYIKKAYTFTKKSYAQAKRLVKQCIQHPKKCKLGGAVLVTGGADSPVTAEHIADAQLGRGSGTQLRPASFLLNYQKKTNTRKHLDRYKKVGQVCGGSSMTQWCDEYPYFQTRQGAPSNLPGQVSLRLAPAGEQRLQGGLFKTLVSVCRLKERPIKKSRFTSIALPSADIPSAALCLDWK
ncbi:Ig-like domain-containing protein [Marinicella litoralis]|uniref:RHS repeat-associated protein/choice-of-anchor A domain-containing protein n=1 Tax=Marinicella litoralis TaxID=644220 RepID=A0A4R6XVA2_9GAMM|nr:Ig-like domain-containing protein [Marinicella litoralis]TDR22310.1 RHS repeat-associated protein/choice-of-anchor A domain-containing protein [Marinicella litoralis]